MGFVYKYVLDGEIIYIGKTDCVRVEDRLRQHGKPGDNIDSSGWEDINASDIYYCELANSTMTDVYESFLINKYRPKYNKAKMTEWEGQPFVEPKWIPLKPKDTMCERLLMTINELEKKLESEKAMREAIEESLRSEIGKTNDELSRANAEVRRLEDSFYSHIINVELPLADCPYGLSSKQIIEEYFNTNKDIDYTSICYDEHGNATCYKRIYTNDFDFLCFDFNQHGTTGSHGHLYSSRHSKDTMTNYNIFRMWENRGNNRYFPTDLKTFVHKCAF